MTAAEIVAEVRAQGGDVFIDGPELVVQRVPRHLVDMIRERKAEVVRELLHRERRPIGIVPTASDVVVEAARFLRKARFR